MSNLDSETRELLNDNKLHSILFELGNMCTANSSDVRQAEQAIKTLIEQREVAARKQEQDRSYAQYLKMQEFYSGGKAKLEKLLFPDHCLSCHTEWADGYDGDEPCCSKATSNIIDSVLKWHKSNPTQPPNKEEL